RSMSSPFTEDTQHSPFDIVNQYPYQSSSSSAPSVTRPKKRTSLKPNQKIDAYTLLPSNYHSNKKSDKQTDMASNIVGRKTLWIRVIGTLALVMCVLWFLS